MVRQAVVADYTLVIDAAGCGPPGPCPQCQYPAARVHSRYWRHVAGLPVGGHRLIVRLRVRRFFCDQAQCQRRTFVEQVAGLAEPRRRCSNGGVVGDEGGRRGARRPTGRTPLYGAADLRPTDHPPEQLTAPPVPARAPRILGIDEFAFRKGRTYGTVFVDIESSRPVDVLPDREIPGSTCLVGGARTVGPESVARRSPSQRGRWHAGASPRVLRYCGEDVDQPHCECSAGASGATWCSSR
ncbi:transposase family protein [Streptomyces sp. NPDC093514]|uniref:transposase family protein n=1 Tax=Streptomyces sp. NPDC093514 TaxID=3366039 RepID=UPI003820B9D9